MLCHDICEMLSPYIDGMLDPSRIALVEEHIAACPKCRQEYDDLTAAVEMVRELPEVNPPSDFSAKLYQQIMTLPPPVAGKGAETGLKRQPVWRIWLQKGAVAAVLLFAVGITALLGNDFINPKLRTSLVEHQEIGKLSGVEEQPNDNFGTVLVETEAGALVDEDIEKGSIKLSKSEVFNGVNEESLLENEQTYYFLDTNEPASKKQVMDTMDIDTNEDQSIADTGESTDNQRTGSFYSSGSPALATDNESLMSSRAMLKSTKSPENTEKNKNAQPDSTPQTVNEYLVTLVTWKELQGDPVQILDEVVGIHGGFIALRPQSSGQDWIIHIPTAEVGSFLAEIKQYGKIDCQQVNEDLMLQGQPVESELQALQEQEQVLLKELEVAEDKAQNEELTLLRNQIADQIETLEKTNMAIVKISIDN